MKRFFLSGLFCTATMVAFACSDPQQPTPRLVMESSVNAVGHKAPECQILGVQWLTIGGFGNPSTGTLPRPVENGTTEAGGTAAITCSVKKSGERYDVTLSAQVTGGGGGTITIVGSFTESGEQTNIQSSFQKGDYGAFDQKDCTVTFGPSPQGIAPGRVWGSLKCPNMKHRNDNQICAGDAEFRFENCTQ